MMSYLTARSVAMPRCTGLLNRLDSIDAEDYGKRAKQRMKDAYSWKSVADKYEEIFSI